MAKVGKIGTDKRNKKSCHLTVDIEQVLVHNKSSQQGEMLLINRAKALKNKKLNIENKIVTIKPVDSNES